MASTEKIMAYREIGKMLVPGGSVVEFGAADGKGKILMRSDVYRGIESRDVYPIPGIDVRRVDISIDNESYPEADTVVCLNAKSYRRRMEFPQVIWRIYETTKENGSAFISPIDAEDLPLLFKYYKYVTVYIKSDVSFARCEIPKSLEEVTQ